VKPLAKNLALLLLATLTFVLLYQLVQQSGVEIDNVDYSTFKQHVINGNVESVSIKGRVFTGLYKDRKPFETSGFESQELYDLLDEHSVRVTVLPTEVSPFWGFLSTWLPMLLIIGVFIFVMRQLQTGGGKAMSFGKSRARLMTDKSKKVTFKDVAGIEESKEELSEIIDFLVDPKKFTKLGGRIPKGVLLMGSPGTGKTLLARAIAGEAGVPFFSISGSDFVEMFVGVGASRVRDLFVQGKKNAPCIIFIDEIDAVGRHRGAGLGGGHDEREQTLNQLLVEMDGFESNEGVILIAATNRPDVLDPALLRPGRFDRRVVVPIPDLFGREEILQVHTRKTPLADDVDLSVVARGTPGFTGADLENLANESALLAARANQSKLAMANFEEAKDKVMMGKERRSMIISDEEKRLTAYHEAGHAMVGMHLKGMDPIHKVTIIPRGMALGLTQTLPVDDRHTHSKTYLQNMLAFMLGGRAAEELIFNDQTTGAGNDIERASLLARKMVCEWGMSEKIGPLSFAKGDEMVFLGKEIAQKHDYSEQTAKDIDSEVHVIISEAHNIAMQILTDKRDALERVAQALLDYETISSEELLARVEDRDMARKPPPKKRLVSLEERAREMRENALEAEPIPEAEPVDDDAEDKKPDAEFVPLWSQKDSDEAQDDSSTPDDQSKEKDENS
jgi:cell division protease FtsH